MEMSLRRDKKKYYVMLAESNQSNEITQWLVYFAKTVLEAQKDTQKRVSFLIEKTKFYDRFKEQLNLRQAKVIARLFEAGIDGFEGGLSAENYIAITQTSRATATRDLQDLVAKSMLYRTGERKSTRYHLCFL